MTGRDELDVGGNRVRRWHGRELVKAGKVPLTVIGGIDHQFPLYPAAELNDWQRTAARRCCARQVVDGRMPREDLALVLAVLGLT